MAIFSEATWMKNSSIFQTELLQRYNQAGPRYTSYPPATEFHPGIGDQVYRSWVSQSNEEPIPKSLSLYFHIPFCSSICYYCACNKVITKNKDRAADYLVDLFHEIDIQAGLFDSDRLVEQLHWGGGTPGFLSQQQMQQLMDKIRTSFRLADDDRADFSIEIDPRVVDKGGINLLRRLGFNRISIGVQDFDEKVQKAVNRIQPSDITAAVIKDARRAGFKSINLDLIYGLPHQSLQSFAGTLDKVIDLVPDRIALYNYAHLPQRFPPQRRIQVEDLPAAEEKIAILGSAIERLTAAGYDYIGMDHFALPTDALAIAQRSGGLHRNFQGYTTKAHCDLVGFGVSALSQIGDHFSQNSSDLEDYHQQLSENKIPVVRGYCSSLDDRLRRDIIQSLICHFRLDIPRIEQTWGISFKRYFATELKNLAKMRDDGLIELDRDKICVLTTGRLLIRNICMVFDRYNQQDTTQTRFSKTI